MLIEEIKACVILPAAGVGERAGTDVPKQYTDCAGRPLMCYTIESFTRLEWVTSIIIPVSPDRRDTVLDLVGKYDYTKVSVIDGAQTRHRSIHNGIKAIPNVCSPSPEIVIVHDAVRPFVSPDTTAAVAIAASKCGAAGVTRPLVSTVLKADSEGFLAESLDRSNHRNSEMPQAFLYSVLKTAYEKCTDFDMDYGTECLHLAQKYAGSKVQLIDGPDNLWKVTHKKDLYAVDGLIKEMENSVLVVGCPLESRKAAVEKSLGSQLLKTSFSESLKVEAAKATNHIIIFLNDEKQDDKGHDSGESNGQEAPLSNLFPDLNACKSLKSLTYILWSAADTTIGDQEFQDFRSLIRAHHLLGKSHGLCTFGVYVEESLLIAENVFQADVFDLVADVVFNSNSKLSGQVFEV